MHRMPVLALAAALALGACRSSDETRRDEAASEAAPLDAPRSPACERHDEGLVCEVTLPGAEVAVAHSDSGAEVTFSVSDAHLARTCGADAVARAREAGLLGPGVDPGTRPGTLQLVLPGAEARLDRTETGVRLRVRLPTEGQRQMASAHIDDWSARMSAGNCPLPVGFQLAEDLTGLGYARTPALALEPMTPPPVPGALPWTGPPAFRAPPPPPAARRVPAEGDPAPVDFREGRRRPESAPEPEHADDGEGEVWQRFEVVDPGESPRRMAPPPPAERDLPFREPSRAERTPADEAPRRSGRRTAATPAPELEREDGGAVPAPAREAPRPEWESGERDAPRPDRAERSERADDAPRRERAPRREERPETEARPRPGSAEPDRRAEPHERPGGEERLMRDALRPVVP